MRKPPPRADERKRSPALAVAVTVVAMASAVIFVASATLPPNAEDADLVWWPAMGTMLPR